MEINKNIVTAYCKMHGEANPSHRMTIDGKTLEESYQWFAKDPSEQEKLLTFQGVNELDEYIRELTKL